MIRPGVRDVPFTGRRPRTTPGIALTTNGSASNAWPRLSKTRLLGLRPNSPQRRRPAAHLPLFATEETDLHALRSPGPDCSDEAIARRWQQTAPAQEVQPGLNEVTYQQPARSVSAIGG